MDAAADAVRYRVLMRIAPALRHGFAGQIQSVYFGAETLVRRVTRAATLDEARAAVAVMPEQAKVLAERSQPLLRWLRPDAPDRLSVDAIAGEVCDLLHVDLSLAEIELARTGGNARETRAMPWMQLLACAMLAMRDRCGAGSTLTLAVHADEGIDRCSVRRSGPAAGPADATALSLTNDAVAVLAAALAIHCDFTDDAITLSAPAR
jgi:hypothetical protein